MARFKKFCHLVSCTKAFESDSRNEKYCTDECKLAAKKRGHSRHKRRRSYFRDVDNRRAQSMSRSQAREQTISEDAFSCCVRCGKMSIAANLECHHRDGNPFNNDKDNRVLVCHPCHAKSDNEWRKSKEDNSPIPEMRNFMLVLTGEGDVMVQVRHHDVPETTTTNQVSSGT